MRSALWLFALLALAAAEPWEEPWVEEEDLEEPYSEEREENPRAAAADPPRPRARRYIELEPYEEYVRVKRCDHGPHRVRRDSDYIRIPRQIHQYEVHEFTEESAPAPVVPYEEMLAASAEHYHRTYTSPEAPGPARFVHEVSGVPLGVRPVPSVTNFVSFPGARPLAYAEPPQKLVSAAPPSSMSHESSPTHESVNHVVHHLGRHTTQALPQQTVKNHAAPPRTITLAEPSYSSIKQARHPESLVNYTPKQNPDNFVAIPQNPLSHAAPPAINQPHVHVTNKFVPPAYAYVKQVSQSNPSVVPSSVQYVAANVAHLSDKGLNVPVDGPVPVSQEPAASVTQLADGDLLGSAGGHVHHHHQHKKHGHGHSAGGGHSKHGGHHGKHGGKSVKGFNAHEYSDKGAKGHKTDEHHKKEYEEAEGHKKKHHDHADHKGGHEEEAHGHRGAHFGEKKGHKKGHKTKGYHNKYHKDEFHKEHKFYDDFHKSGEHHRFGKFHAKHASDESGKKKAHHVNAGHDFVERGKKGYSNKGHLDADHKGHKAKHGHEEHHESHKNHGKKGGSEGGKEWGYAKKN